MLRSWTFPGERHPFCVILADPAKRLLDILAASLLLGMLVPLFLGLAFVVVLDGGPVFFAHWRVGRHGVPFPCYKFRTMMPGAEHCLAEYLEFHPSAADEWRTSQKLSDDPRITGVGRFLRKASLDELPQLWNVLRGDMSLVGPRPVTEAEITAHYGDLAPICLSVRPGLTGPWQVVGRNALTYERRVAIDAEYARTRSFTKDIMILFKTVSVVIHGDGV